MKEHKKPDTKALKEQYESASLLLYGHKNIQSLQPKQIAIVKACVKDKVL
jgi:hypothetical protein